MPPNSYFFDCLRASSSDLGLGILNGLHDLKLLVNLHVLLLGVEHHAHIGSGAVLLTLVRGDQRRLHALHHIFLGNALFLFQQIQGVEKFLIH